MKRDGSVFDRCRLLVVGDLMLDEYLWGEVERISPEAPVPVVSVTRENYDLGGAANVAKNLAALGAKAAVAGVVGRDPQGRWLQAELARQGLDATAVIEEPGRPTTLKTRVVAGHQQVVRIDRETTRPIAADTEASLLAHAGRLLPAADVVLISDYGKGVVSRRIVSALAAQAAASGKIAIADPKGIDFSKYAGLTLITPNRKEAALAAGLDIHDERDLAAACMRLLEKASVEKVLITCGPQGMVFVERGRPPLRVPARARQVFDVSGAGDTVLAVLGLGLAAGCSFPEAVALANAAAGVAVSKLGAAAVTRAELMQAIEQHPLDLSPPPT
ncbi:MAG: D-glycero-beta-D-manno-heptose-7-phosphate kinase [Desulfobacterales bacterium]|nr:D-glycero-beta-D-manno-heptose-7-phosphate kinase [Desulfobacterales bacterium]